MDDDEPTQDAPDPIDAAITATDPTQGKPGVDDIHLRANWRWDDGRTMLLEVPVNFTPEDLEIAIALLLNLRQAAHQRALAMAPIVGLDGRPIRPT